MSYASPLQVWLCEFEDSTGRHTLTAALDELTLTYRVVDGSDRPLCEHIASLREAREWAESYRDARCAAPDGRT